MPALGPTPEVQRLDENRRDDYEYIAGVLLDHVEALIDYNADVQARYAAAYKAYVDQCDK